MMKTIDYDHQLLRKILIGSCIIILSGCAAPRYKGDSGTSSSSNRGGGYYQDDGPGTLSNIDLDRIPNAVVRDEPIVSATTRPYTVLGKRYVPMRKRKPYKQRGEISWYGKKYHNRKTSIGETYDMYAMTAAHPLLPLPSYVKVTNLKNGRTVIVRVNDRGPFLQGRILDLSYVAAAKLGYVSQGTTQAEVELIMPRNGAQSLTQPAIRPSKLTIIPAKNDRQSQAKGYYVQVGAFSKMLGAQTLKKKLNSSFTDKISIVRQKDYYKVWVGPFRNQRDLNNVKSRLWQYHDIKGFRVVRF